MTNAASAGDTVPDVRSRRAPPVRAGIPALVTRNCRKQRTEGRSLLLHASQARAGILALVTRKCEALTETGKCVNGAHK
jgi:hypothetical protein